MAAAAPQPHFFEEAPVFLVVFWVVGPILCLATIALTIYHVQQHTEAARKAGFHCTRSCGARTDRINKLLTLPPVFSLTAVMDLFVPGLGEVTSLVRICWFASNVTTVIELLFILEGHATNLMKYWEGKPLAPFGQPPCCCLKLYKVTKPKVWQIVLLRRMMQQYIFTGPLLVVLNLVMQNEGYEGPMQNVANAASAVLTVVCMIGFKNLGALIEPVAKEHNPKLTSTGFFTVYVLFHNVLAKILNLIVGLIVKEPWDNGVWVMPVKTLATVYVAMALLPLELLLALKAFVAFPRDERMYPPPLDGWPMDTIVTLQLSGVQVDQFEGLKRLSARMAGRDEEDAVKAADPAAANAAADAAADGADPKKI